MGNKHMDDQLSTTSQPPPSPHPDDQPSPFLHPHHVTLLQSVFAGIDVEIINSVLAHHSGDLYPAVLQLLEFADADMVDAETVLALAKECDAFTDTDQIALDTQIAMAMQEELSLEAAAHEPPPSSGQASSRPNSAAKRAKQLAERLTKLARYRSRTGAAMRLLDSETVSSADASNSNPEIEIHMPADESDAPPISTTAQPASLPEQYEARMQRARAARSMTTTALRDQLVGTRA